MNGPSGTAGRVVVLTDPAPIRSLPGQFSGLGAFEAHVLDTTRLSPQETAATILRRLAAGAYLLTPATAC